MGAKKRGSGGRESPIGMGSGGRSPPETEEFLKVVRSKFYAFFGVVFHTFSPTYAYVFSILAGIIPLSPQNEGGGHLISFAPLSTWGQLPLWGATAPLPPGSTTYGLLSPKAAS